METKIYKKEDKILIEIPAVSQRFDPYSEKHYGSYSTLTGIITEDESGNLIMGFGHTIDMAYKGKDDQYSDIFFEVWGVEEEEFIKLCKEIGVKIIKIKTPEPA